MADSNHWIPVQTSPGMFSLEYAISLTLHSGATVSFYADKALVQFCEGQALLRVTLVSRNADEHVDRVMLPTETFETGTRWVDVPY